MELNVGSTGRAINQADERTVTFRVMIEQLPKRILEWLPSAVIHPLVVGELACGTPPDRSKTLADLNDLHHAQQATLDEVMAFVNTHKLYGQGYGLVDMTLLASTLLSGATLWTLDKRLAALANRMGVEFIPPTH